MVGVNAANVSTQPESGSKEKETQVRVSPSTNSGRGTAVVPVTIVVDEADKSESVWCQLRCAVLTDFAGEWPPRLPKGPAQEQQLATVLGVGRVGRPSETGMA
jgi:hypothetical protein